MSSIQVLVVRNNKGGVGSVFPAKNMWDWEIWVDTSHLSVSDGTVQVPTR
jgi:hypothetical protein